MLNQHINHNKKIAHLRGMLKSEGMLLALGALDIAEANHTGFRKDGVTAEIAHPVAIASYLSTLPVSKEDRQALIAIGLLHDVPEDYSVSEKAIVTRLVEVAGREHEEAAAYIAASAWKLSKFNPQGQKYSTKEYFKRIESDPLLAIAKGADGLSNIIDAPSATHKEPDELWAWVQNYKRYIERYHLPTLKFARQKTEDESIRLACENVKFCLVTTLGLTEAVINLKKSSAQP